jgi:hypothetical protein
MFSSTRDAKRSARIRFFWQVARGFRQHGVRSNTTCLLSDGIQFDRGTQSYYGCIPAIALVGCLDSITAANRLLIRTRNQAPSGIAHLLRIPERLFSEVRYFKLYREVDLELFRRRFLENQPGSRIIPLYDPPLMSGRTLMREINRLLPPPHQPA